MTSPLTQGLQGVRWFLSDWLRGQFGDRVTDWLGGAVDVVKCGPHRDVYRLRANGLDVHVKHYRPTGLRSRIREALRPVKAKREYERGLTLRQRGVPTPLPLAWGTSVGESSSWLVTETFAGGVPLNTYLEVGLPAEPAELRAGLRLQIAKSLGTFVARLHAAGVFHHDLHPGNLLVRWAADGRPEIALIDLHATSLRPRCRWADCRRNLVVFNRYFALRATRSDRRRFWEAYLATLGPVVPPPAGQAARELERATADSNRVFWRGRDRRCLANNRYYRRVSVGSQRGYAVRDLDDQILQELMANTDAPFDSAKCQVMKRSPSSAVVAFELPSGSGVPRRVVLKRFAVRSAQGPWLGLVRPTAALRSWLYGHGLHERRLPTPRPLAVFYRYRAGLPREGYLLSEMIEGATELHDWLRRLGTLGARDRTAALRQRADYLARLIRGFHDRGLTHRDLKAANVLTPIDPADHRAWLIDLVGVRRPRHVTPRRRAKNLARLNASFADHPWVTRTQRLRFLATYLEWGLRGKSGWKAWWREIGQATQAKVARNTRRGRPLA
jgi:tRNA A-37 threonylcarbamoyl transferase component Bud32